MGKGENAGYQHFLLFLQCFQKASYSKLLKVGIVWQRVKTEMISVLVIRSRTSPTRVGQKNTSYREIHSEKGQTLGRVEQTQT